MTGQPVYHWRSIGASVLGSAHARRGASNEDAFHLSAPGTVAGIAVADGHGDQRAFRARIGAEYAAEVGTSRLVQALRKHPGTALGELDPTWLADSIVGDWRVAVVEHFRSCPPTASELTAAGLEDWRAESDQQIVARYGTTLLAAAADQRGVIVCQVGDGDLGVVHRGCSLDIPVGAPDSIGQFTTSMAMPRATEHLRVALVELTELDDVIVWACTDGFSGAQAEPGWQALVAEQLTAHCSAYGPDDLAERLPGWMEPAARTGGDDTTMAILVSSRSSPGSA